MISKEKWLTPFDVALDNNKPFVRESLLSAKKVLEIEFTDVEADWINELNNVFGRAYSEQGTQESFDSKEQVAIYHWNGSPASETILTIRRAFVDGDLTFKVNLHRERHNHQMNFDCLHVSRIMIDPITRYVGFFAAGWDSTEPALKVSALGKVSLNL